MPPIFTISLASILACTLVACSGKEQKMADEPIARYLPDKISDWTAVGDHESYDRETIFRYINGAGEVYLQYDFRKLAVRRYSYEVDYVITAEVFDMGVAADAFGIFSHSREGNDAGIGSGSEFKGGLLCFWKNRYFVCIYADKQSEITDAAVMELGATVDKLIPEGGEIPEIVKLLPGEGLLESRTRFFHKYTSLNLHYYLSDNNILNLDSDTDAVLAEYEPGKTKLLLIEYDDRQKASSAHNSFIAGYIPESKDGEPAMIENAGWVMSRQYDDYVAVVFDSSDSEHAVDLAQKTIWKIKSFASKEELYE
jgi:hypothetical protein